MRALRTICDERDDVKLVFLGTDYPQAKEGAGGSIGAGAVRDAVDLARDLDLLDRHVFFNHGWADDATTEAFLADADAAVSTYFDNLETHFSFRVRYLDQIWASLPMICTRGDVVSEMVERRSLGVTVPAKDQAALVAAIRRMTDPAARDDFRSNLRVVREEFRWEHTLGTLIAFCSEFRRSTRQGRPPASARLSHRRLVRRRSARKAAVRVSQEADRPRPLGVDLMTKILVMCHTTVGSKMASAAIRAYHMSRVLQQQVPGAEVTLAIPRTTPSDLDPATVPFAFTRFDGGNSAQLARDHDILISTRFPLKMIPAARGSMIVLDLFTPLITEWMELTKRDPGYQHRRAWLDFKRRDLLIQMAAADLVLVSNERQRDLILGAMATQGMVTPRMFEEDPRLERLFRDRTDGRPARPARPRCPSPARCRARHRARRLRDHLERRHPRLVRHRTAAPRDPSR